MKVSNTTSSNKQDLFREIVLGTLLYSVVLGFFNDYTDILSTKSYSTTFAVAIVMQLLTYATFLLKDVIVTKLKQKENVKKAYIAFSIWLIMFFSKFIFLAVLDFIFGDNIEISGFIGLLLIIICLTVAQKIVQTIYEKLGTRS
jgi:hypothetical protein